jgi:predicted peroxiredoxin
MPRRKNKNAFFFMLDGKKNVQRQKVERIKYLQRIAKNGR